MICISYGRQRERHAASHAQDTAKPIPGAISGGFGADVKLKDKGAYAVKTKVVAGETTLMDDFSYEVK